MNTPISYRLGLVAGLLVLSACLPAQLDKYRNKDGEGKQERASDTLMQPGADGSEIAPQSSINSKERNPSPAPQKAQAANVRKPASVEAAPRASIYAIDRQTYRFALKDVEVWDAALNVLLRNYNLLIVDRTSGIITTEWDSYYLNKEVFRNKLSIRVAKSSYSSVDVTVHNSVEKLRDASQAAGTVGAVWLPASDPANEVARIVQNMALVLNQPPPVLPPNTGTVARGSNEPEEVNR